MLLAVVCLKLRVPLTLVCLPPGLGRPVEAILVRRAAFCQGLDAVLRLPVLVCLCPGLACPMEALGMMSAAFFQHLAAMLPLMRWIELQEDFPYRQTC